METAQAMDLPSYPGAELLFFAAPHDTAHITYLCAAQDYQKAAETHNMADW